PQAGKRPAHGPPPPAPSARRSAALKRVSYSSEVATPEASSERQHVPAEVAWKPAEQPEARLTMYTIAPHRGNLREAVAREERLHRDLEPDLEAVAALEAERVEQRLPVHAERAGRVRYREPNDPMERPPRRA